ncbi:uncharacterized protein LOC135208097 [Macrobrachium nipponense]|uniref:uncharacterized protein LOC135208097 n=1 Tax=Macrobrachium nipponense TaxID=159736 RepID=UPI0030C88663
MSEMGKEIIESGKLLGLEGNDLREYVEKKERENAHTPLPHIPHSMPYPTPHIAQHPNPHTTPKPHLTPHPTLPTITPPHPTRPHTPTPSHPTAQSTAHTKHPTHIPSHDQRAFEPHTPSPRPYIIPIPHPSTPTSNPNP